jgi:ABC-type multidrug transport system permease subunit
VSVSPRFRSAALGVAWRQLHRMYTNPALLIPSLIFPLFFFTAFAGGLSNISNVPGFDFPSGYTAFQFCFVLLQASAFGGVFTGFGIAGDFEAGFARRLMLATSNRLAIVLGYSIAAMTRTLITITILFTVGLIAGMQVDGGGADVFGMIVLALLVNIAATMWATGIAMRMRTIQAMPLMQLPVFLVLFMAPVYVPLDLIRGWVGAIAPLNPLTLLVDTARSLISGQPDLVLAAFATGLGLVALFATWAIRGLRRAEAAG